MNREEMLDAARSLLEHAGFKVSKRFSSRPSCFCIAARKHSDVTFIKVPADIGKISIKDALELQAISGYFSATSLLVGDKSRIRQLEDDTVYTRYGIYAITLKTLEDVVNSGMLPLIEAGPGGYYVRLDGDTIRCRRMKLGLSIGKLAEQLRISRRTLYGYERGMAKASVSAAYNLEWILGNPVVKPIDVFKPVPPETGLMNKARKLIARNRFLQAVVRRLVLWDFKVTTTARAPFDFVAQAPDENIKILGVVVRHGEKRIHERTEEILNISDIVGAQPLLFTAEKMFPENNIPSILTEEFEKMEVAEDLWSRL